jgi:hypothetical protein
MITSKDARKIQKLTAKGEERERERERERLLQFVTGATVENYSK